MNKEQQNKIENAFKVKSVNEEYTILMAAYGIRGEHWTLVKQSLIEKDSKFYDKLIVKLQSGEIEEVYFDINSFYNNPF